MFKNRWFPRLRKKQVIAVCVFGAIVFLLYQVLFLVLLNNETQNRTKIHFKDINSKKAVELNKENEMSVIQKNMENKYSSNSNVISDSVKSKHSENNSKKLKTPKSENAKNNQTLNHVSSYHIPLDMSNSLKHSKHNFQCKSSGVSIEYSKLNDNYCDCPEDGSDEPLTNACENSVFYCLKQKKGFMSILPAGFVNDGICDCCDGSDEWAGHTAINPLPRDTQKKLHLHHPPCPDLCT